MENAITYAPDDATSYYLLGEWHYTCSTISWFERNIASIIYGKIPKSSMETALEMFELAERTEPGFYSKNLIMLVKSMIALKRKPEKIAEHLQTIKDKYKNSEKWDDQEVLVESE
jgi:regulator of microtubule dynamics protein 1